MYGLVTGCRNQQLNKVESWIKKIVREKFYMPTNLHYYLQICINFRGYLALIW
jgi:hypothetical protein